MTGEVVRPGDSGETGGRQYSRGDGTPGWQALEEVLGELAGELNMPGNADVTVERDFLDA